MNYNAHHQLSREPSCKMPLRSKIHALDQLIQVMVIDKNLSISAFTDCLGQFFTGLEQCLKTQQLQILQVQYEEDVKSSSNQEIVIDIILKGNQFLFEVMPEIQHNKDLEVHMAQLIPVFIENLGSPKAVVRKSTHKCIGTYVKLTKKLEFVLRHIISTGLENQNSRTRQHSMLVIPALLSLKSSIMEQERSEMSDLLRAVIARILSDPSEIVAKTGKKLVLELHKCYPTHFITNYVDKMSEYREILICKAIIKSDDQELKRLINLPQVQQRSSQAHSINTTPLGASTNSVKSTALATVQMHQKNELSNIGKEILMNVPQSIGAAGQFKSQIPQQPQNSRQVTNNQKDVSQNQEGSGYVDSGDLKKSVLIFGFLNQSIIDSLDENKSWKERTTAMEQVEQQLNFQLSNIERKQNFAVHTTGFLNFIVPYIKDLNVKLSLTAITITNKLLVTEVENLNTNYNMLAKALIEKLSDSKVVIRQAVLKCSGVLIRTNTPSKFCNFAISYLDHTNWYVREGILHLLANCLIVQGQQDELNGNLNKADQNRAEGREQFGIKNGSKDLALCSILIGNLCKMIKTEMKQKILFMAIDILALCIDISKKSIETEQLIKKELDIQQVALWNTPDESQASTVGREFFRQIKQRQSSDFLPAMQLDGSIEFKFAEHDSQQIIKNLQNKTRIETSHTNNEFQQSPQHQVEVNEQVMTKSQSINPAPRLKVVSQIEVNDQMNVNRMTSNQFSSKISAQNQNDPQINEKIQTWLPSYKLAQEDQNMQHSYAPQEAFQGQKRRVIGSGINSQDQQINVASTQNSSLNKMRRQTSLPKGQQLALFSTGVDRGDELSGPNGQPLSSQEPLSAGIHLGSNPKRSIGNSATDNNLNEQDKLIVKATSFIPKQQQIDEQKFQKLIDGYTPIQHQQKPRFVQSNEVRQRTLDNVSITQTSPSPKLLPRNGLTKNEFISIHQSPMLVTETRSQIGEQISLRSGAITGYNPQTTNIHSEKVQQLKNMSQSSGAPGGFGVNKAQINERLQLLKSTFKYKNQSEHEYHSNLGDARTFDNTDRRIKYDATVTTKKANSEYNARDNTKLPAVNTTLNNNNYMLQTGGGTSGVGGPGIKVIEQPQQTLNSFALSNVSTNMNNNFAGPKSYSANKQLQSTNTTGYNFGTSESKVGAVQRRDLNNFNAYESSVLDTRNMKRAGTEKSGAQNIQSGIKGSSLKGPIKATPIGNQQHHQEQIGFSTIQFEQNNGLNLINHGSDMHKMNNRPRENPSFQQKEHHGPQLIANRKPPVSKGSITQQNQQQLLQHRASSVSANFIQLGENDPGYFRERENFQTPKKSWNAVEDNKQSINNKMRDDHDIKQAASTIGIPSSATQTATHYNAPEEPLRDPDAQFKQSVTDLKSQDWQKIFDGLNTVKRVAQFHKELLIMTNGPLPKEAIKLIVKHIENLRSQISKNACMTLQVVYSELPTKDLDSNIELVLPALLKKSTDTNHFVSEQAEKALMMVCHACSETKVLNCIQMADGKGGNFRQKVALSYCFLIERLGQRMRNHKDNHRIVKAVVQMLGEGSAEARNQAKIAISQLKNSLQNGREFDGLMMRCGLTDQQIEQARKVSDWCGDGASSAIGYQMSNNTRYGGSMRGSSMDSRGHGASEPGAARKTIGSMNTMGMSSTNSKKMAGKSIYK